MTDDDNRASTTMGKIQGAYLKITLKCCKHGYPPFIQIELDALSSVIVC